MIAQSYDWIEATTNLHHNPYYKHPAYSKKKKRKKEKQFVTRISARVETDLKKI
jgi:hypothetical protein